MAVLGSTTLTGCLYIENFLGGTDPTDLRGFRAIFENASAPTSWVKDTTYSTNGIALRVVTGNASSRTNFAFSQTFTTRSLGLTIDQNASAITFSSSPANISSGQQVASATTPTTSNAADLPSHSHLYELHNIELYAGPAAVPTRSSDTDSRVSTSEGSSQGHSHSITFGQHSHTVNSPHTHTISGQHNHTVPGPASQEDFSVLYRDVIIAEKSIKP
jgi:hypothetical protein